MRETFEHLSKCALLTALVVAVACLAVVVFWPWSLNGWVVLW